MIVLSDCDLIIANVEDHKCFVVVVTAVDSVVVVLIILRVQNYALSWIFNIIIICILEGNIIHCLCILSVKSIFRRMSSPMSIMQGKLCGNFVLCIKLIDVTNKYL